MERTYSRGDVVILKSGSIGMTVAAHDGDVLTAIYYNQAHGTIDVLELPADCVESLELVKARLDSITDALKEHGDAVEEIATESKRRSKAN